MTIGDLPISMMGAVSTVEPLTVKPARIPVAEPVEVTAQIQAPVPLQEPAPIPVAQPLAALAVEPVPPDPEPHRVPVAVTLLSRLLGLALLRPERAGEGLLIPRCRSVHTFGMRFRLDLIFLDDAASPVSVRRQVPPRRVAVERRARAVLELPATAAA